MNNEPNQPAQTPIEKQRAEALAEYEKMCDVFSETNLFILNAIRYWDGKLPERKTEVIEL